MSVMGSKWWRSWDNWKGILAAVAIVISIIALGISAIPVWCNMSLGEAQTPEASGYGFIRGIDQFTSDHIVLPLVWENTGGQSV